MAMYVFAVVEENSYDTDDTFDSYEEAICGEEIAVQMHYLWNITNQSNNHSGLVPPCRV